MSRFPIWSINKTICIRSSEKYILKKHRNDCEADFTALVQSLQNGEVLLVNYRKQVLSLKGIQRCSNCGAEIPKDACFCNNCGTKVMQAQNETDTLVKCVACGNMVSNVKFCTACGVPLNAEENQDNNTQKVCPNCGSILSADTVFCTSCGTKL